MTLTVQPDQLRLTPGETEHLTVTAEPDRDGDVGSLLVQLTRSS